MLSLVYIQLSEKQQLGLVRRLETFSEIQGEKEKMANKSVIMHFSFVYEELEYVDLKERNIKQMYEYKNSPFNNKNYIFKLFKQI